MRLHPALLALLALPSAAAAGGPQVTDPSGDALLGANDVVAVTWSADAAAVHADLALAAPAAGPARYVLSGATPGCASVTLTWVTGRPHAALSGCGRDGFRELAPPRLAGTHVVFSIPRAALPGWLAPGTRLSGLGAETAPYVELHAGALYPPTDTARSDASYVIGE